jgi:hypothetical protein
MVSAKCVRYMLARDDDTIPFDRHCHPFVPNMNFSSPLSLAKLFDDDEELLFLQNAQTVLMQAMPTLKQHGGSATGRAYIDRDRAGGHQRLYNDYFAKYPTSSFDVVSTCAGTSF